MNAREQGLAAALDAAGRGLGVLPAAPSEKRPRGAYRTRRALTSPEDIAREDWSGGVCAMLGAEGTYVLDGDTPEAAEVVRQVGAGTLRVKTRRGVHAYFRRPPVVLLRQGVRVAEGIDGKGIAATGTPTVAAWWQPDGSRCVEHDAPIAELPAEWVTRIGPPREGRAQGPRGGLTATEQALHDIKVREIGGLPDRGHNERALRGFAVAVGRLAIGLSLGDGWGDVFYREAARYAGEFVAAGDCTITAAEEAFRVEFKRHDTWGHDATNVFSSIRNGLVAGAREGLECL